MRLRSLPGKGFNLGRSVVLPIKGYFRRSATALAASSQRSAAAVTSVSAEISAAPAEAAPAGFGSRVKPVFRFKDLHPKGLSMHVLGSQRFDRGPRLMFHRHFDDTVSFRSSCFLIFFDPRGVDSAKFFKHGF